MRVGRRLCTGSASEWIVCRDESFCARSTSASLESRKHLVVVAQRQGSDLCRNRSVSVWGRGGAGNSRYVASLVQWSVLEAHRKLVTLLWQSCSMEVLGLVRCGVWGILRGG